MPSKIPETVKSAIRGVNESLRYFEAEWISTQRTPYSDKERIHTLRQYLECRLNMEFWGIPELSGIIEGFDGHFLEVMSVQGEDPKRRRFETAIAYVNKSPDWYLGEEDFPVVLEKIEKFLGGTRIQFNNSPKRPKIIITK